MTRKLESYRKLAERSPAAAAEQMVVLDHALTEAVAIVNDLETRLRDAHGLLALAQDISDAAESGEEGA